jgi:hypothetical protein
LNVKQNPISRRQFSSNIVLGGIGFFLLGSSACNQKKAVPLPYHQTKHKPLNEEQFHTLDAVLNTIFPDDGNGPDARAIGALNHVISVINDKRLDPKENRLIVDKLDRFIDVVAKKETLKFYELNSSKQLTLLTHVAHSDWGGYWVSRLTTLTFEALLSDPMYGVNTDGCGWDWLDHLAGHPAPKVENLYPAVFDTHEI